MAWVDLQPYQRSFINAFRQPRTLHKHRQYRAGDEMACSCGKRWPVGEDHP